MIKIPTLGIHVTVKFPWVARPSPLLGLDIDRCIKLTGTALKSGNFFSLEMDLNVHEK